MYYILKGFIMTIKFRDAKTSDAKEIFTIWANGWRYAYKNILSPEFLARVTSDENVQKKISSFKEHFENSTAKGDIFIVATDNDKIIGQVSGGSIQSKECKADSELHGMYIDTNYIGKGVGKILFQEFAKHMKNKGAKTFGLMCFSDNESMKFYKHMGGVVTIERPSSEKFENTMGSFLEFNIDEVLSK